MTKPKKKKKSENRQRQKFVGVRFNEDEYSKLLDLSSASSQAPATYLRTVGLNKSIKSVFDKKVYSEMCRVRADLGRLGGLIKAWLSPKQADIGVTPESKKYLEKNKPELKKLLRDLDTTVFEIEDKIKDL